MSHPEAASPTGPEALAAATAGTRPNRGASLPLLPLLLLLLALGDLRIELLLLLDHFTLTSLLNAISSHPLAVVVLMAQPSLWRHYRSSRRS